jgi:hypothetical protein
VLALLSSFVVEQVVSSLIGQTLTKQPAQQQNWTIMLTHVPLQPTTIQLVEEDVMPNLNEHEDQNSTDQHWLKSPRQSQPHQSLQKNVTPLSMALASCKRMKHQDLHRNPS